MLVGHNQHGGKKGAFWSLQDLKPGAVAHVGCGDGVVASWRLTASAVGLQTNLEAAAPHMWDTTGPRRMVLVTCTRDLDASGHSYKNLVLTFTANGVHKKGTQIAVPDPEPTPTPTSTPTSTPTPTPTPTPPQAGTPTITGTPAIGSTLRADPGAWKPSDLAFDYLWFRNGLPIPGSAAPTYTVQPEDEGKRLAVLVMGKAPRWDVVSVMSAEVRVPMAPTVTEPPVIEPPATEPTASDTPE